MARGGRRTGTPGKAYGQRVDLAGSAQAMKAAPGQAYGMAQQQRDSQRAVPVAGTAVPPPAAPVPPQGAPAGPSGPMPGMGFGDPSARPNEAVTAGLSVGPGGGPEMLGQGDDTLMQIRAAYAAFPNEEMRAVLQALERAQQQ